jgi:hypothetical protein
MKRTLRLLAVLGIATLGFGYVNCVTPDTLRAPIIDEPDAVPTALPPVEPDGPATASDGGDAGEGGTTSGTTPSGNPFATFEGPLNVGPGCDDSDSNVALGAFTPTNFIMTGLATNPPITFTVTGATTAEADGVTQFGMGGHKVVLTLASNGITMAPSSSQGSCSALLTKK